MNKIRKIILSSLFFSCLFSTVLAQAAVEKNSYVPDAKHVKPLGRTIFDEDVLWMDFTCTGAAFNIEAKFLEIEIAGDSGARMRKDNGSAARIGVFVNGEKKVDQMILKQNQKIVVFDESSVVKGEVQIVKLSEGANSMAGIVSINTDVNGKISPVKNKKLKIEFVGDSITCGYGVDDLDRNHHFATATEDGTKTYAYKTAKALDADYSFVSVSGWGIYSGYTSDGMRNDKSLVPSIYTKSGYTHTSSYNITKRPQNLEWDFSNFEPDVVVINLGTNDASYCKTDKLKNEYVKAYVDFIKVVRQKNPKAKIICALGIMGQDLYPEVEKAVNQSGDKNVYALKLDVQLQSDGYAADWHPSEKSHEKAALKLTNKIKEILK